MKCPYCGAINPPDADFCLNCGKKLPKSVLTQTDKKECPRCHHLNALDSKFCENCGYAFTDAEPEPAQPMDSSPADTPARPVAPLAPNQSSPDKNAADMDNPQPDTPPNQPPVPPQAATPANHRKVPAILAIIVLIALMAGTGWVVYNRYFRQSAAPKTTKVAKTTRKSPARKTKAAASSSSSEKASSSSKSYNTQLYDEVQAAVNQTMGQIPGDNSVFVSASDELHLKHFVQNNRPQRAASIIKIFIMVTAFAKAQNGDLNLADTYTVAGADKVSGTGDMQNMPDGTPLSYRQVMDHMMEKSDNMAANVMIDYLGGLDVVNQEIKKLGFPDTVLERKMMDTDALAAGKDNMTSVQDLGDALTLINNGKLISKEADNQMMAIMKNNQNHEKLPAKITNATAIYNKTGEFGQYGVENDAAIVQGDRHVFVAVVMSQNGHSGEQIEAESNLGEKLSHILLDAD